jgi:hypothetical protein
MASTAVALSGIETASIEDLLQLAGDIEAQIHKRVDAIQDERRKRRERIQAILRDAGLDTDRAPKRRSGRK